MMIYQEYSREIVLGAYLVVATYPQDLLYMFSEDGPRFVSPDEG